MTENVARLAPEWILYRSPARTAGILAGLSRKRKAIEKAIKIELPCLGLAIAIERIIYLNLSTTNTKKLAQEVEDALQAVV
jgi:hypothetical protein